MCEHHWQVESAEQPDAAGRRKIVLVCVHCDQTMTKLTARSEKQIRAELDAQPPLDVA